MHPFIRRVIAPVLEKPTPAAVKDALDELRELQGFSGDVRGDETAPGSEQLASLIACFEDLIEMHLSHSQAWIERLQKVLSDPIAARGSVAVMQPADGLVEPHPEPDPVE